jgi:hypothetical protein
MERVKHNTALAAIVLALAAGPAASDVIDSSANGFTIKAALHIKAAPHDVYRRLIRNIGDWWNPQHTFSGNSHNLSIDEKAMGCFCERLPNEGAVRHMEVIFLAPDKTLGMTGGLGPLQSMAAAGNMKIDLSPEEGGTKLDVMYAVTGYLPAGMNTWAAPVNSVLTEQFTRLKNYVEHGAPVSK